MCSAAKFLENLRELVSIENLLSQLNHHAYSVRNVPHRAQGGKLRALDGHRVLVHNAASPPYSGWIYPL